MIREIEAELDAIADRDRSEGGLDDSTWTSEIYARLGCLGRKLQYKVCSTGGHSPAHWNQFLYDHCWLKYDANECLSEVGLALETEWSNTNHIDDDFQKLLASNAKLRVMVFQKTSETQVTELFDDMAAWALAFKGMPAQRFLLCGWSVRPQRVLSYRELLPKGS
jgi:hypothetical protein